MEEFMCREGDGLDIVWYELTWRTHDEDHDEAALGWTTENSFKSPCRRSLGRWRSRSWGSCWKTRANRAFQRERPGRAFLLVRNARPGEMVKIPERTPGSGIFACEKRSTGRNGEAAISRENARTGRFVPTLRFCGPIFYFWTLSINSTFSCHFIC